MVTYQYNTTFQQNINCLKVLIDTERSFEEIKSQYLLQDKSLLVRVADVKMKTRKKSLRMNRQESWELLSCVCKEFSCHPSLRWINICHLIYLRNFSANPSKNSHYTELSEKWLRTYQNTNQFYSTSWRTS